MGPGPDRRGPGPGPSGPLVRPARPLCAAGGDRSGACGRPRAGFDRLGRDRRPLRRTGASAALGGGRTRGSEDRDTADDTLALPAPEVIDGTSVKIRNINMVRLIFLL